MNRRLGTIIACLVLAGCASSYEPVIDQRASQPVRGSGDYQRDLDECRQLAERRSPAREAAVDALIGAAVGAALGAATGGIASGLSAGTGAAIGAAGGGIIGVSKGASGGVSGQKRIIDNCMRGRGWAVVN